MSIRFKKNAISSAILLALVTPQPAIAAEGDALDAGAPILVNQTVAGNQVATYRQGDLGVDANGNFVAVWTDYDNYVGREVLARRFNADGTPRGDEFVVNTVTTGTQTANGVAVSPGGAFVVVFDDNNNGIYAQLYGADGVAVGEPMLVETAEFPGGHDAQVAMAADGRFVVVWTNYSVIYYRRFAADGTPLDTDAVEVVSGSSSKWPGVAMDPVGNYVIVWENSNWDIMARRYSADGTALDVAGVSVNENSGDDQFNPDVAMDAGGNYVISWVVDYAPVAGVEGVYFRRFAADGTALGGDVATMPNEMPDSVWAYFQMSRVAMDADGNFAVTGADGVYSDGDGEGTYIQRYDSSGNALYASPVNVGGPAGSDFLASVAMDADGDTVVLYNNINGDDGDGYGVYAERYEGAGKTVDLSLVGVGESDTFGADFTYTYTVTNNGSGYALAVKLEDVLPSGVSYSSFTSLDDWSCSETSGTVSCTLPSLAPAAQSSIDITVDISGVTDGVIENTATISNAVTESDLFNNRDTVTATAASGSSGGGGAFGWLGLLFGLLSLWPRKGFRSRAGARSYG